jgi:predicted O-linked N-acetylglucosamine transferase (SPINDLY family)
MAQQALTQGIAHHNAGQVEQAESCYREVLRLMPRQPDAVHLLGLAAYQSGRLDEAETTVRRALMLAPEQASFWNSLGTVQQARGRHDEAAASFARAVALAPEAAEIWSSLGTVQLWLGRLDEAEASQRRALALRPEASWMLNNLGAVLVAQQRWPEAVDVIGRAVALAPTDPSGWGNLGHALQGLGNLPDAIAAFERALALAPDNAPLMIVLADALQAERRLDEAVPWYERARSLRPADPTIDEHLGVALWSLKRRAEAVAAFRRSLALAPDQPALHSGLIFALDMVDGSEDEAREERQRWSAQFGRSPRRLAASFPNEPRPDRPLRVGYVSPNFCLHSAGLVALAILEAHDRANVTVVCYSGVTSPDATTARFQQVADLWRDVAHLSDDELDALIRADQIDILVDLSGHMLGNRLPVFAREPAPIQVTAWGYVTGTGLDAMQYLLADPIVVPTEARGSYAEEVVDLPSSLCYRPPVDLPDVAPPPLLAREYVTFGAFNRLDKVSPGAVAAWARILAAVPDARLLVKTPRTDSDADRRRLRNDLVALGVAPERIELRGSTSQPEHFAAHADVDVLLDTHAQSGGITTIEAMMMGVPTVALLGEGVHRRSSASFLTTVGLGHLVAGSVDEYVGIAIGLAGDAGWLTGQRATLRARLLASPIGDTRGYTRAVEDVYRTLWQRWCATRSEDDTPAQ